MEYSNENTQPSDLFELKIDTKAQEHLRVAIQWARIVAIVSFISLGVNFIEIIVGETAEPIQLVGAIFGGLIGAAISLLIYIFLYKFATNMKTGLDSVNQDMFNIALRNLKTHFKVMGIIFIIALSLMVLFFLFFFIGLAGKGLS